MTFQSAYLKLTLFYVLIVMLISICFSVVVYRISAVEISRGLLRQTRVFRDLPGGDAFALPFQQLEDSRMQALTESNHHIALNLIYFNLLILGLSAVGSYFMAKRTLKPIEEMMEGQNRFTADASHELRTPLTAMRTEIEVALRDKKISLSQAKDLLSSNLEEISKLESLSNALLKLAKYQEDAQSSFESVLLSEAIVEAYEKVEGLAKEKSIEFKNNFKEVSVNGDKQSLVELFIILLDNAIKYSPAHSRIDIAITSDEKQTSVSVHDHGIGIKASDLPYIFNRFYRADNSRSKETTPGYGLGLSIAKQIVDLHHGEITAISKPGKGSQFTVRFPLT